MEILLKLETEDAKLFLRGALKIDADGLTEEALEKKTKETLLGVFFKIVGEEVLRVGVLNLTREVQALAATRVKEAMGGKDDRTE